MKTKNIILFILILFTFNAFAQKSGEGINNENSNTSSTHVLIGKIDGNEIIFELKIGNQSCDFDSSQCCSGRFYEKLFKTNINLIGHKNVDGTINLKSVNRTFVDSVLQVILKPADGKWIINFEYRDSIKLNNIFKEINIDTINHPLKNFPLVVDLKEKNYYEYVLLSKIFYKYTDTITLINNIKYIHKKEKLTNVDRYTFIDGYNKNILQKINNIFDTIFFHYVNDVLTSDSWGSTDTWGWLGLINSNFIVLEGYRYWTGSAHPDGGEEDYVIDAKRGELIDNKSLLIFGNNQPTDYYSKEWFNFRDSVITPIIYNIIFPDKNSDEPYGNCDYAQSHLWTYDWVPKENGICLGAYFPRCERECDNNCFLTIPYDKIRKYLNPKYVWPK